MYKFIALLVVVAIVVFLLPSNKTEQKKPTENTKKVTEEIIPKPTISDFPTSVKDLNYGILNKQEKEIKTDSKAKSNLSFTPEDIAKLKKADPEAFKAEQALREKEEKILNKIADSYKNQTNQQATTQTSKAATNPPGSKYINQELFDYPKNLPNDLDSKTGPPINVPPGKRLDSDGRTQKLVKATLIESVILRTGPGYNYPRITRLNKGAVVSIDYSGPDWARVFTVDGVRAWIPLVSLRINK